MLIAVQFCEFLANNNMFTVVSFQGFNAFALEASRRRRRRHRCKAGLVWLLLLPPRHRELDCFGGDIRVFHEMR